MPERRRYSSPGVRSTASSQGSRGKDSVEGGFFNLLTNPEYQRLDRKYWEGFFVPGKACGRNGINAQKDILHGEQIFMYQLHESELDDYNKRQKFLTPSLSSKPVYRRCVVINGGRESSQCL